MRPRSVRFRADHPPTLPDRDAAGTAGRVGPRGRRIAWVATALLAVAAFFAAADLGVFRNPAPEPPLEAGEETARAEPTDEATEPESAPPETEPGDAPAREPSSPDSNPGEERADEDIGAVPAGRRRRPVPEVPAAVPGEQGAPPGGQDGARGPDAPTSAGSGSQPSPAGEDGPRPAAPGDPGGRSGPRRPRGVRGEEPRPAGSPSEAGSAEAETGVDPDTGEPLLGGPVLPPPDGDLILLGGDG